MAEAFYRDGNGALHAESVPLTEVAARYGTPAYVYSRACMEQRMGQWKAAFAGRSHLVCYAVKASSNIAILALMARLGSGFDIVSGGELQRVLAAGGRPDKVVFSGVGKSKAELELALRSGLKGIHVESLEELQRLAETAGQLDVTAPVAIRVCPEIEADTHQHIRTGHAGSKFGMSMQDCEEAMRYAAGHRMLQPVGIACHMGSQLMTAEPFVQAAGLMTDLLRRLDGVELRYIDLGGGLGVGYGDEKPISVAELASAIEPELPPDIELVLEPGRSIVAPAGILLTKVEYIKRGAQKSFAVVDAGMNDFMRPAVYDAWHNIEPVQARAGTGMACDVVGPVCESSDYLGKDRELDVSPGDLLAVRDAGAYGASMACEYNTRPRPCELLVDGANIHQIRPRDSVESIIQQERIPDELLLP